MPTKVLKIRDALIKSGALEASISIEGTSEVVENTTSVDRKTGKKRHILISAGMGTATYFGDLKDDGTAIDPNPWLSIGVKAHIWPRISGKLEFNYFRLSGSDEASSYEGRSSRNLSFRSTNLELNISGILHLLPLRSKYQRPFINPYGFIGIGLLYFNPMGKIPATGWQENEFSNAGTYIPLRPLQTENVAYTRVCLVAPVGGGVSFKVSPSLNLGLEASYSATTTDYLDDVSTTYRLHESFTDPLAQAMADKRHEIGLSPIGMEEHHIRGNPAKNDGYFSLNIKVEYYLP